MRIHRHAGVLEPSMDTLTPAHRQPRCGDPSVTMLENNISDHARKQPFSPVVGKTTEFGLPHETGLVLIMVSDMC